MLEPRLICSKCGLEYLMEEGSRISFVCSRCHSALVVKDSGWVAGDISGDSFGSPHFNADDVQVAELWLPPHNEVDIQAITQFLSSLPLPVALEYWGDGTRRVMLVRAPAAMLSSIAGSISSLWPQAHLHVLDNDPVSVQDQTGYGVVFDLEKAPYLPIRMWESFLTGDPVHSILSATLGLNQGEKLWFQIHVRRTGKPDWLDSISRRLKTETQRGFVTSDDSLSSVVPGVIARQPVIDALSWFRGGLMVIVVVLALISVVLGVTGHLVPAIGIALFTVVAGGGAFILLDQKNDAWKGADLGLVKQKVVQQDSFFLVSVRAFVWADSPDRASDLLRPLYTAMSQFAVSGGNNFRVLSDDAQLHTWFVGSNTPVMWLGGSELAGLWHPPIVNERVAPGLIPVNGIEIRAPDPQDVTGPFLLGSFFRPGGGQGEVSANTHVLRNNVFMIGKPGTGKTNMMEWLVLAAMKHPENPSVIVLDPHGDMVNRLMGIIDPEDVDRLVVLDIGDRDYALTYNPLDVKGQGWSTDQAAQLIVDIGKSLWEDYWGPRMQIPLNRAVKTLAAVNEMRAPDDLFGLSMLSTLLSMNHESRMTFLKAELDGSPELTGLLRYFAGDFATYSTSLREQIIQPVLSKAYRFVEHPMLELWSASRSLLNWQDIIQQRKVLLVNTRMDTLGDEISDFVGSLLLNVLLREIARQGEAEQVARIPVTVVVDEFQTYSGVPWEKYTQQIRKWGGAICLGTQSLASLREQSSSLPGIITSGVYSLFCFAVNGEDAQYLAEYELAHKNGGPSPETLQSLRKHWCYARMIKPDGVNVTRPFTMIAREPSPVNVDLRNEVLARRSRYSMPYTQAVEEAEHQLANLDRYASFRMKGTGAFSAEIPAPRSRSSADDIAGALIGDTGDARSSVSKVSPAVAIAMPWDNAEPEETDPDTLTDALTRDLLDDFDNHAPDGA